MPTLNPLCLNCGGVVQPTTWPRVGRCAACQFLVPQSVERSAAGGEENPRMWGLEGIAPDGVLRGKYRLMVRLGEGAHGVSYLAEHLYLGHLCVVKIVPHATAHGTDAAVARLRNEARAGYRVQDENVVRVLDCDVVHGRWYFVMEYVDGCDLAAVLAAGLQPPWQQVVAIGADAAAGLWAIHRAGLVHCDIKPGNLLLGQDGRVRVADLGVARLVHERWESGLTGPDLLGTLAYAPPEMFAGGATLGPAADLYSLGATLYHLLVGRPPHHATQVFRQLVDLQTRAVAWPERAAGDVPAWLREAVLELLAIEPDRRTASAAALIQQLAAGPVRRSSGTAGASASVDALRPRGLGVLPLRNEHGAADDDWLGFAVGHYLARALAEVPGVYAIGPDALVPVVERLAGVRDDPPADAVREAGRIVGAGTVLTGRFTRTGERITLSLEAWHTPAAERQSLGTWTGTLAELAELERRLLAEVLRRFAPDAPLPRPSPPGGHRPVLAARERLALGRQAMLRGALEEAIALGEEAVRLDPDFAEALGLVGVCQARLGRYAEAEVRHRTQEALARQWGDRRLEVEALANLGVMNYFRGQYEAAEAQFVRAAALADEAGLATEGAQIHNNLGFVLFRRGRLEAAEQAFRRAIDTHRAFGALTSLVGPYNGTGNVLVEQRRYAEARHFYQRALALAAEIGDRTSVGTTHMHLGRCAALEGQFATAQHEFTMALSALEETRFWNGLARLYEYMADMNLRVGNLDEALRCADKRVDLARQHANARLEAAAWAQKAAVLTRLGRVAEAQACAARGTALGEGATGPRA